MTKSQKRQERKKKKKRQFETASALVMGRTRARRPSKTRRSSSAIRHSPVALLTPPLLCRAVVSAGSARRGVGAAGGGEGRALRGMGMSGGKGVFGGLVSVCGAELEGLLLFSWAFKMQ